MMIGDIVLIAIDAAKRARFFWNKDGNGIMCFHFLFS